ncbi:MAG: hypothetical protein J6K45_07575 [Clostridia bacterium]|nr:hypothetical protein [Clostridia bacterium]MBP3464317.1 hypothetical protein [Clostridia bacterium]
MKKETLLEIILGTIGGLIFAIGMCMCLIPEWNLFKVGVVVSIVGFIILLGIIPVYKTSHPKKEHAPVNWGIVATWIIGVIGALVMGFGMSQVMTDGNMVLGLIFGVIGLIVCVLNYPIYAYIKSNK